MKKMLCAVAALVFAVGLSAQTKVPYTIAEKYFLRNDAQPVFDGDGKVRDYVFIESKEDLERTFGYGTIMGPNGKPTAIDFTKQFAIGLFITSENTIKKLTVKSLVKKGNDLVLAYEVESGDKAAKTDKAFKILIIDKKYGGPVKTIRTNKTATKLSLQPLSVEGGLGQTTFSKDEKTYFYYNAKTKSGEVNINGKKYKLTNYKFINNQGTGKPDGFKLSGSGVTINAPGLVSTPNDGGDCFYGTIPVVTITLNGSSVTMQNVSVQDCPNY